MIDGVSQSTLQVGKISHAHGIKGELFLRLNSAGEAPWISGLEKLEVIGPQGKSLLTLEKFSPHKGGYILKCKEVGDRNAAELLKGAKVVIPSELLVSEPGEAIYLNEILGFEVVDKTLGPIGAVSNFLDNNVQDLLVVNYKSKERLIPFVKELVEDINYTDKKILMNLPEGLLDL